MSQRARPPHAFDPVTLRCLFCGAQATRGSIVCSPHPDYLDDESDVRRCCCGIHATVVGTVPDPGCPTHGEREAGR